MVRPLGKGGMGAVYLAEHPMIGSRVAIKFLHPQFSSDKGIVDRFFNEARAVNLIGHDNILKILDLDVTQDGRHYFVMEFLEGRSLQACLKPDQPLPLAVAGPILLQICAALQAAHEKRIVHRDLKPDNIQLIAHDGRKNFVKVVDFGIAKLSRAEPDGANRTQTGIVMGTPAYMSPEQGTGEGDKIDGRSDVYSLGVMMFQMATGKLPFPGQGFADVLIGHVQRPPPSPRSLEPSIPADYEAVILKTLAKDRDDRYRSMADLRTAIRACLDAHGLSAQLPAADPPDRAPAQPGWGGTPGAARRDQPAAPDAAARGDPGKATRRGPGVPPPPPGPTTPARAPAARPLLPARSAAVAPPERPPRRRLRAALGAAAGAALVAAGVVFARPLALAMERPPAPSQAIPAEADRAAPPVLLSAASVPPGATVEAVWPGGTRTGLAPLSLEVPRNAKVHVGFTRTDCKPYALEVVADAARTVTAPLDCGEAHAAAGVDVEAVRQEAVGQEAVGQEAVGQEAVGQGVGQGPAGQGVRKRRGPAERRRDKTAPAKKAQTDALIDLGEAFR